MSGVIITGDPAVIREIIQQETFPTKTFKSGKVEITVHLVTQAPTKVINKLTGQSVMLPAEQVDLFDLLIGIEKMLNGETPYPLGISNEELEHLKKHQIKQFRAIRAWFMKNNLDAYFTLID